MNVEYGNELSIYNGDNRFYKFESSERHESKMAKRILKDIGFSSIEEVCDEVKDNLRYINDTYVLYLVEAVKLGSKRANCYTWHYSYIDEREGNGLVARFDRIRKTMYVSFYNDHPIAIILMRPSGLVRLHLYRK